MRGVVELFFGSVVWEVGKLWGGINMEDMVGDMGGCWVCVC